METISQEQKIELFKLCANINCIDKDGMVYCYFHMEWRWCDGTKCPPSIRENRADQGW